jgi:MFS superfamily sulfate permease-like transporter
MKRRLRYYRIYWLKHDLPAGLSVFFVALPLCLGIALASGAPLYAGIVSGIIGGVVVSLISKSSLAVSGPGAGLTTVVITAIATLGDYRTFLLAVIIAGIFQVLLGVFRLGSIANYFPSSVIKGMLAAIGIMLIVKQIPVALGYDQPDFWTSGFLSVFKAKNFSGYVHFFNQHTGRGAIIITIISLVILIVMARSVKRSIIPPALVAVLGAVVVNELFMHFESIYFLKPTQLVNIPSGIFSNFAFPDVRKLFSSMEVIKHGAIIGILASLETLLCIEAIDKLDKHNRITPVNRELVAQGIGNMLCGLAGAIPITAVIVRGSANIDAGARTKLSAFTHGLFLLLAVMMIPFLLNKIPYAALAAILIVTGYNLTKPKLYKNMWSLGRKQFMPFIFTIIVILLTDLLVGVSIGLLVSVYYIIQNNFKAEYITKKSIHEGRESYYIKLSSMVTFLNKVKLKEILDEMPEDSILTIDGSESHFIDYDILEIISEFSNKARDRNIELHLVEVKKVNVEAIH